MTVDSGVKLGNTQESSSQPVSHAFTTSVTPRNFTEERKAMSAPPHKAFPVASTAQANAEGQRWQHGGASSHRLASVPGWLSLQVSSTPPNPTCESADK